LKTIDLENHFATESWLEALKTNKGYPTYVDEEKGIGFAEDAWMPLKVRPKLLDLDEGRIALMDAAGVDFAVLSLAAPGCEQLELATAKRVAQEANDTLGAAIKRHPDRFGGFAALVPKDPEWSAAELERCVKELGFTGWNTHSNFGDSFLDEKQYWPLLAKVEELGVPIYLHPTVPMIKDLREFGMVLAGPTFGFGVEVAYVFLRMIVRGVFDEYPNLKIIMGHYGEALPFLVDRVDRAYMQKHNKPNPQIGPGSKEWASYYLKRNLWVTTSGNFLPAAFMCTRDGLGMDKILLGTDFPYEHMEPSLEFLASLPLSEEEKAMLYETNAKGLGF
jgi:predicted TIM-barrel fold metal-dependent hydrolase